MRSRRGWCLLAALLFLPIAGCVDGGGLGDLSLDEFAGADRASIETIAKGSYSGHETNGFRGEIATDQVGWESLWAKHTANQEPAPDAPEIDFSSQFVAAAFMGRQRTGGHAIQIVDMPVEDGKFHAGYATVRPGQDCITSQAITYPFHIAAVDRMNESTVDVVFHNAGQNVRDC